MVNLTGETHFFSAQTLFEWSIYRLHLYCHFGLSLELVRSLSYVLYILSINDYGGMAIKRLHA